MTIPAVALNDVVKRFSDPGEVPVEAVDHVTLEINNGEFFSLLGPSGCGKTTSLRMIAGFEWPSSGTITIAGKVMGRTPAFQRPVNTVFQNYALFQHMTIYQNVAFGLEMDRTPAAEIKQRVESALEMVQLKGMQNRKPRQLSGGQQQRVALARALVKRPAVLLLDEPLGALDQKLRKDMQFELKSLQEQVGITFIYVTHDQEEALTMSDRIAVMNKGRALQIGTPVEIYERPANRFVADFIGETNFLPGAVRSINGQFATVELEHTQQEFLGLHQNNIHIGQKVVVSVRPEKIELLDQSDLSTENAPRHSNTFPGTVLKTTYIGSDSRIVIEIGRGVEMRIWYQNNISTLDPQEFYVPGESLWVSMLPENVLILPDEE